MNATEGLVAVLDREVVLRSDGGWVAELSHVIRGAQVVLVNGALGVLSLTEEGRPLSLMAFTIVGGKIAAMHAIADPERLDRLSVAER